MTLEYTISKKADKEMIKACDEGARGMQDLTVETARVLKPGFVWLVWLLTRFYQRKITNEKISYNFYLLP